MSNNVLEKLRSRIFGGGTEEDKFVTTIYVVMKKFKLSFEDIKNMPIPTFQILVEEINKENRIKEREYNKMKKPVRRR